MTKVKDTLHAIKREIIWHNASNSEAEFKSGLAKEFGMPVASEVSSKRALDLVYSLVAADGELGGPEEAYINNKVKDLELEKYLSSEELQNVMRYNEEAVATAKAGGYKGNDLSAVADAYSEALKTLGIAGDTQQGAVKAILFTAIGAAKADGLAVEEQQAMHTFAELLHIKPKDLDFINKFIELEERFNSHPELAEDSTFNSEIIGFQSEVADFS